METELDKMRCKYLCIPSKEDELNDRKKAGLELLQRHLDMLAKYGHYREATHILSCQLNNTLSNN